MAKESRFRPSSVMDKFRLLMWKNFILQIRHPMQTIVEILAPTIFSLVLIYLRYLTNANYFDKPQIYPPFELFDQLGKFKALATSPNNPELNKIMGDVQQELKLETLYIQPNNEQLERFFLANSTKNAIFAAVSFDDAMAGNKPLPTRLRAYIRFPAELRDYSMESSYKVLNWYTEVQFPLFRTNGPRKTNETDGGYPPGYNREGFLILQQKLFEVLYRHWLPNKEATPHIMMQRFPYPPFVNDRLMPALQSFIGLVMLLSFIYSCINLVKIVTVEKEKQMKEVMKIMGLPNWLHWLAWYLKALLYLSITAAILTMILKVAWFNKEVGAVFGNTNGFIMYLFLLVYCSATVTFAFMVSVFFSKANLAATMTGLFFFIQYTPYLFFERKFEKTSSTFKIVSCLCSNTAMGYGFLLILLYEGTGRGLQWDDVWRSTTTTETFCIGHVFVMLLLDSLIYLLVAIYVENICPGEFGVAQKWYYLCSPTYWRKWKYDEGSNHSQSIMSAVTTELEQEPTGIYAGIQTVNLRKEFGKGRVAVRNLNINMYEGQITVLLGHNGAGKTTTMSMLTGMLPPTSGTAFIMHKDIRTNIEGVRRSLGICPQHNVVYDELTVKEHLWFFGRLKGLPTAELEKEIDVYIKKLDLEPKKNNQSHTLSGGMKRKLCVGMALIGGSKVVMLDEPTSGMDPAARRTLWDLLQEEKKGRTMLLSTHFMDEADLLGDRIAIMAGGILQCCGSSYFLKKRYGAGYLLILDTGPNCRSELVTNLLRKYIPDIQIQSFVGTELTYLLQEDKSNIFESMLSDLEKNMKNLNVNSYGISLTNLEEVFLKVGADHGQQDVINLMETQPRIDQPNENNINQSNVRLTSREKLLKTGFDLYMQQVAAMFLKKFYFTLREWRLLLVQIVLPIVFLIIAVQSVKTWREVENLPPLDLRLSMMPHPIVFVNGSSSGPNALIYTSYTKFTAAEDNVNVTNVHSADLGREVLHEFSERTRDSRENLLVGASFLKTGIIAWFSNIPYHMPPVSLNLVHNAIIKFSLGRDYSIDVVNYPFTFTQDTRFKKIFYAENMGFQLSFQMGFSMAFISSFYMLFYIRERVCKAKHLQFVSGVKVLSFWIPAYLSDMMTFVFATFCLLVVLFFYQEEGYDTVASLSRYFLIFTLFGMAIMPVMYLASYLFEVPASGYARMCLFNLVTGTAFFLVVEIMKTPELELEEKAYNLEWVFMVSPLFAFSNAIRQMYYAFQKNNICYMTCQDRDFCWKASCDNNGQCCEREAHYFNWERPGVLRNIVYLISVALVLTSIVWLLEWRIPEKIVYRFRKSERMPVVSKSQEPDDSDVIDENEKIRNMSKEERNTYNLVLRDVSKYYRSFLAVNKLCLGLKKYECFGLLGVNGAGKTTTFKMMTGDIPISYGDAWVNGYDLKTNMEEVYENIGYCPQFDALIDDLTGRETLIMFGILKGYSLNHCREVAEKLSRKFNFENHIDKKVKNYSGGNKRKLSTAIALFGDPTVVYLDEPTTGMDPAARRQLWNILLNERDNGRCIVLTSHSMEECEALCTKIAIMVNGHFKCLGSRQHLKSKYSEGMLLMVKLKKPDQMGKVPRADVDAVKKFVEDNFPTAMLREEYQELLYFFVPSPGMEWSQMFGIMESGKRRLKIEDYSVGQSSLEQVFLQFTKFQTS